MVNAFEYSKNNERTSQMAWLRAIPFISYGYIKKVLGKTHVRVRPVVQKTQSIIDEFDVTLLSLSSASFEFSVMPQEEDLVLLFSLDKIHPDMFNSVMTRTYDEEGNEKLAETEEGVLVDHAILHEQSMLGYTGNAMVGILASTIKGGAALQASVDSESFFLTCNNPAIMQITKHFTLGFIAPSNDTYEINVRISNNFETNLSLEGMLDIKIGFRFDGEQDIPVDAPVTILLSEKAPVSLVSESTLKAQIKKEVDIHVQDIVTLVAEKAIEMLVDGTDLITIGNKVNTLGGILEKYNDILSNFDTVGSPASHSTGPGAKAQLAAVKTEQEKVFG